MSPSPTATPLASPLASPPATPPALPARRATLVDVAAAAGVSRQTVSNAVNAPHLVRAETLRRVLAVVADLDYRPDPIAREMRNRALGRDALPPAAGARDTPAAASPARRGVRGAGALVVRLGGDGGVDGAADAAHVVALASGAADLGRATLALPAAGADVEAERLAVLHDAVGIAAVVLDDLSPPTAADDPRVRWAHAEGVAVVATGGTDRALATALAGLAGVVVVTTDDAAGAATADRALLAAGHERVASLGVGAHDPLVVDRGRADPPDDDWPTPADDASAPTEAAARRDPARFAAARRAVARMLAGTARPTAVVCADPTLALAAVAEVRAWGLTVGEDVTVVALGDSPALAALDVAVVAAPPGALAAACLEAALRPPASDPDPADRVRVVVPVLVARGSLGPPPPERPLD